MRYAKIRKMDVSNGPGIRVSLFVQGCTFNCKNCFNPETHDFNGGEEFTAETLQELLKLCEKDFIVGFSILGGEPMHPKNIKEVTLIAKKFKEKFPHKDLWIWTGFLYENLREQEIMNYLDVLVDGQYVDELHDFTLQWRGSANQRVIDIKQSQMKNKLILLETQAK